MAPRLVNLLMNASARSLCLSASAFNSAGVSSERLAEELWPFADSPRRRQTLITTLSRIKKDFNGVNPFASVTPFLLIDSQVAQVDSLELERLLQEILLPLQMLRSPIQIAGMKERIAALANGVFLPELSRDTWALIARERIAQGVARADHRLRDAASKAI